MYQKLKDIFLCLYENYSLIHYIFSHLPDFQLILRKTISYDLFVKILYILNEVNFQLIRHSFVKFEGSFIFFYMKRVVTLETSYYEDRVKETILKIKIVS